MAFKQKRFLLTGAVLSVLFWGFSTQHAFSQEVTLYGYSLGEHKKSILAQLGDPELVQSTEDEIHWIFYLGSKQRNYIVFSFSKKSRDILTGIQVTGSSQLEGQLMKGIRLGDKRKKVENIFGSPDVVEEVEEIEGILCRYSNRNYSFEFVDNKLYSVRIHRRVYLPQLTFFQHFTL